MDSPLSASLGETFGVFDGSGVPRTTPEVAEQLGLERRTAYARLERLVDAGRLETKKVGANARVWWRPADEGTTTDDIAIADHAETGAGLRDQQFRSLVEATEEYAIFVLDEGGHVRTWNTGAERIKGYERDEILGEHVATFYTEADREAGVPERNLAAAAGRGSVEDEGWRVRADGSRFWANVTITALYADGELDGYAKVIRDMTERKRAETERELLYETTRAIAEAGTVDEGLGIALDSICGMTDWAYGEAWRPTDDGLLRRTGADYHEAAFEAFAARSTDSTFARGEGLPGRVWASGEPEWIADVSEASTATFARAGSADAVGLQAALAVPIVADGDTVAVLVFLMDEARAIDERRVETVSSVAAELGDLVVRRQAQEAVKRERDLMRRVLDTSPVAIGVFDRDGDVTRLNERATELLAVSQDGVHAYTRGDRPVYDGDGTPIPPDEQPLERVLSTGDPVFDWQARIERPAGGDRWLSVNAAPIFDSEGEVHRVVTTVEDITRLKEQTRRLERQRQELEGELEGIFTRIDEAFIALDEDWRITYVNESAADLVRLPAGELIESRVWDVLPEVADGNPREMAEYAMATQESVEFEFYSELLDIWVEIRGYPSETGMSVYVRDVTDRKEREREIEKSRRRYRTLVENFPNGAVALVDEDLRYRTVGGTPVEEADVGLDSLEGSKIAEVLPPEFVDALVPRYEAALEGEASAFEETFGERTYEFRVLPVRDDDGDIFAAMGVSQDITERKRFEERLTALYDSARDLLGAESASTISERLVETAEDVLGVPGLVVYRHDADRDRLVPDAASLASGFMREEFPEVPVDDSSITGHAFASGDTSYYEDILDVPYLHMSPDAIEMRAGLFVPLGEKGILVAGSREVDGFDGSTRELLELLATNATAAYERVSRERELIRQREQLAALNNLNEVVREITGALVEQSTREEIERTVCERLADSESYLLAWIGDADPATQTVNLRAEAGVEGYLDGVTISVDPDDERSNGPTGRAFLTGEPQVTHDIAADDSHDPWRDHVAQYDFRSSAAVPITHEGTVYGVLNVYTERPSAFLGDERQVIVTLGEVVGHAIAAGERKQALMNDELIELDFQIEDVFAALDVPVATDGRITFEDTVAVDDEFLVYGTASRDAVETVRRLAEVHPDWESVRVRSECDPARFEAHLTDAEVLSVVASLGGYVERAVIEDGDCLLTVHLAPGVDVREVIDAVTDSYPEAEMLRRRQIERTDAEQLDLQRRLVSTLTDRQRTALEVAYRAGFFEWPRDAAGEDVADAIGIAASTFHQHLRKAERKVFETVFSTPVHDTD